MSSKLTVDDLPEPDVVRRRARGRPRDPERMARLLETAQAHFSQHGYEGASLDAIAAACGVSKVTIYSYFPTKAALFAAAITHRIEAQFSPADWPKLDPKNPRQALLHIGRAFLGLMRTPDVVNRHRTLYGAQGVDTAAAEAFYVAGPQRIVESVAAYLLGASRAGTLGIADPSVAADQYLSLYLGRGQIRALLGLPLPAAAEDEKLIEANVALFLRGYAARGLTPPSRRHRSRRVS